MENLFYIQGRGLPGRWIGAVFLKKKIVEKRSINIIKLPQTSLFLIQDFQISSYFFIFIRSEFVLVLLVYFAWICVPLALWMCYEVFISGMNVVQIFQTTCNHFNMHFRMLDMLKSLGKGQNTKFLWCNFSNLLQQYFF